jgi:hypothetical protein
MLQGSDAGGLGFEFHRLAAAKHRIDGGFRLCQGLVPITDPGIDLENRAQEIFDLDGGVAAQDME